MIMQLSADPTHEYGSCGGDSGDGVCDECLYCILTHLFACLPITFDPKIDARPHTSAVSLTCCMYY